MYPALASLAAAVLLTGCSVVGIRSGYEEPTYTVVDRIGDDVEVRRYQPRLAAQTLAHGSKGGDDRNEAFRRLFDYISGANREGDNVAMTVPVETSSSPSIAITAPIETSIVDEGQTMMRFFLPSTLSYTTAPEPNDSRIQIQEIPESTQAVLRFSGLGNGSSVQHQEAHLLTALDGSQWSATGDPTTLFYDPPWTLPFLRRNEVAIPVIEKP